ncbi:hypothetical protein APS56_04790 [Pseudalgibacter alginicilyticus]|uniref:Uncharacterized protein n=2 Tax=Pseudalgibacter alginicilyticus TaxID=1736674 RepID=A0A0P0CKD2_9FLAO|nr:hypothetical protein APS56_04790 [Pseudalgibacter alginicilyticus]
MRKINIILYALFLLISVSCKKTDQLPVEIHNNQIEITSLEKVYSFTTEFTIIYTDSDPNIAARPGGIDNVSYNVITWETPNGMQGDLKEVKRNDSQGGDGFDDRILDATTKERTPIIYNAGENMVIKAQSLEQVGDTIHLTFPENEKFSLEAYVDVSAKPFPKLSYSFIPKIAGYFSIGYTGAPKLNIDETEEIWQPLIWQEKRFPEKPFMTLAYRTPIPTTLVHDGKNTIGVLAASEEFPFNPLPLLENSRFGVMLRNLNGEAQPQLFAPVLGGVESKMEAAQAYNFSSYLVVHPASITQTYEHIAYNIFGFDDYRKNEIASLNDVFENIVEYSMSQNAWYVDSLKGYAYSTDVPGAVKNVSSLNPLEISLVTDDKDMFDKRAYPIMEYIISREKFLFSLDPEQKIQQPSRKMYGPAAPLSELTTLYNTLGKKNDFLLQMAKDEVGKVKARNLDVKMSSDNWMSAMYLYKATGESKYIEKAKTLADEYINERINEKPVNFTDPLSEGAFFWTGLTPRWIQLLELYELTKDKKYLDAAQYGARHYTMFTWMSPQIPDKNITVNKDGKAPVYWYLASKGHTPMYYPEEQVPAWRLSEMGLTPESTGTSTGHRAIFMANYAPWMLRVGYYANDQLLKDVAKSAIIGRYRNFPGYHINTARTTAYEKFDYPYHKHKELSVNSFHYNHILPMASMLLDYLVTDAFVRSEGKINFPSEFIEGYAYLQNKFYGSEKGDFYDEKGVQLWMPKKLLAMDNLELNYITARKDDKMYIAFTNQSNKIVKTRVSLNSEYVDIENAQGKIWKDNVVDGEFSTSGSFDVEVSPNGITAVVIDGVHLKKGFQESILAHDEKIDNSYKVLDFGNTKAMIFNLGNYAKRAYIYLQDDDSKWSSVSLTYKNDKGAEKTIIDQDYPYEFTIPLENTGLEFMISGNDLDGKVSKSSWQVLGE